MRKHEARRLRALNMALSHYDGEGPCPVSVVGAARLFEGFMGGEGDMEEREKDRVEKRRAGL